MLILAGTLLFAYLLLCLGVHYYSFRPLYRPQPHHYTEELPGFAYIESPQKRKIATQWLHNPQARWTILFSHGNRSDLGRLQAPLQTLYEAGFSVFAYDYPGYGLSPGRPSEASLYDSALAAYEHLCGSLGISPNQLILMGRSLGGGPTLALATQKAAAGMILESTFLSIYRAKFPFPFLIGDKFCNIKKASRHQIPTLVVHGTEDLLIPITHGKRLFKKTRAPKKAYWVEGAGHYDFQTNNPEYWEQLSAFCEWLEKGES